MILGIATKVKMNFSSPVPRSCCPSGSHRSKENVSESAMLLGNGSADDTADDDVEMEEEAPLLLPVLSCYLVSFFLLVA